MSAIPEGSIVITPADMYGEVKALTIAVRDLIASDKAESSERAELKAEVRRLRVEVDAINKKLWMMTGAAAAVGGGLGSWLPTMLGH
jgi:hypothetical protein